MEENSNKTDDSNNKDQRNEMNDEISRIRSSVASRPSQTKCNKITPEDFKGNYYL